ncbi:NAD-dependent epimerase/dehydratase family protein [Parabacteroides sp. GYB001]|uniref:NAD-dependent epimerase/dehydratase family protein n=1 Tax=Parabacteroides leei TaxID=2939491 RepID=UPI002016DBFF|nr:NAD-dependent epimerase/dehydratase family protein [Parabacteroides leei]MCL3851813.1 NAD-dependent epimerase/dehydratase family protein [Parabacteroides leei]
MNKSMSILQDDMNLILQCKSIDFEVFSNKSILITGATGMIASYLVHSFMRMNSGMGLNIDIYALVRNETKAKNKFQQYIKSSKFHLVVQDIAEPINITESIHFIVHAAGGASPFLIQNDPVGIIRANTIGTFNVLNFAKEKCAKVLYTSTREVYGKVEGISELKEDSFGFIDPLDQRSCYPECKRIGEQLLKSYSIQYGVDFWSVRIAHSYGPGMSIENDGRVMSDFISDAVNKRDIILKSDGRALRAFCYITDCITAILTIMSKGRLNEAYNVANEAEEYPIKEVARIITKCSPKSIKVVFNIPEKVSVAYCNYKRVRLNTNKLLDLQWTPRVTLEEGILKTLESYERL